MTTHAPLFHMNYSQYCYHNQAVTLSIKLPVAAMQSFVAGLHSKGHC